MEEETATDTSDSEEEEKDDLPPAKPSPDAPSRTLRSQSRRESHTATTTRKGDAPASAVKPKPASQDQREEPETAPRRRKPANPSKYQAHQDDPRIEAAVNKTLEMPEMRNILNQANTTKEKKKTLPATFAEFRAAHLAEAAVKYPGIFISDEVIEMYFNSLKKKEEEDMK